MDLKQTTSTIPSSMLRHLISLLFLCAFQTITAQITFQQAYASNPLVPHGLLEAVAWTNTRMVHLSDVTEGCSGIPTPFGIMGLHDNGKEYFYETGQIIAELSGISIAEQKLSAQQQISAHATAFNTLMEAEVGPNGDPTNGNAIRNVLHQLSEIPEEGIVNQLARDMQVYAIFDFMRDAEMATMYNFPISTIDMAAVFGNDNYIVLSSPKIEFTATEIRTENNAVYKANSSKSIDFGPAIWNPAPSCNFSSRNGVAVSAITIHTVQGSYAGAISWAQNCSSNVSYHYVIRSSDGQITQMVSEADKGWHVGSENPYTIGYEHEGYVNNPAWYTDTMYGSSAAISVDIINSGYGIPAVRTYYGASSVGTNLLGGCTKIKGHQHYPNQTHTDPGINWDWERYYRLINNNPSIITLSNASGGFYDTGGPAGNYLDDERVIWLIEPSNVQSITLDFTLFNVESGYDNLFIYDGNSIDAPLIGQYTGTNSPGIIVSSGGALTVEFRSDCGTVAPGWEANYTSVPDADNIPETAIIAGTVWQNDDFQVSFNDTDLDNDISERFYLIAEKELAAFDWSATGAHGFAHETFDDTADNWTDIDGTFSLVSGGYIFSDVSNQNSNTSLNVAQDNSYNYLYEWDQTITSADVSQRAGMHFFCDDVSLPNRGNSYFIFLRQNDNKAQIYSVVNDVFYLQADINYTVNVAQTYNIKTTFKPTIGLIQLYIDNAFVGQWQDPVPLTSGNAVSIRTAGCEARFDNVRVYKSRGAQINVTAGFGEEMSIESENATPTAKIKTLLVDNGHHWSQVVEQDYLLDFTPPEINVINDGNTTDIDTFYTATLESNWDIFDIHSNISDYTVAVGTLPNLADVVPWTSNGISSVFSTVLANPTYNNVYYVSVQATNNAGLTSIFISDGQRYLEGLGLEDMPVVLEEMTLYPNPASHAISFKNAPAQFEVIVTDMQGKICQSAQLTQNDKLDIHSLAEGSYHVIVRLENAFVVKSLVVIK